MQSFAVGNIFHRYVEKHYGLPFAAVSFPVILAPACGEIANSISAFDRVTDSMFEAAF